MTMFASQADLIECQVRTSSDEIMSDNRVVYLWLQAYRTLPESKFKNVHCHYR